MQTKSEDKLKDSMPAFAVYQLLRHPTAAYSLSRRTPLVCAQGNVPENQVRRSAASVLTVAAAAAFALPFAPPIRERMAPAHRHMTQTAGMVALAGSVMLRKTPSRMQRVRRAKAPSRTASTDACDDKSNKPLDLENEGGKTFETKRDTKTSISSAFSGSRAEWEESPSSNVDLSNSGNSNPTSKTTTTDSTLRNTLNTDRSSESSTVYSFSFRSTNAKARKSQKSEDSKVDSKTAFSHMRKEFGTSPEEQGEKSVEDKRDSATSSSQQLKKNTQEAGEIDNSDLPLVARSGKRRGRRDGKRKQVLEPLSGIQIARRIISLPVFLLREVILPVTEVGSVLWFDTRARLVDWVEGQSGYLVETSELDDWDIQEDKAWASSVGTISGVPETVNLNEESLSEEERQILQVERMTTGTVNSVQTSLQHFTRLFLRW